MGRSLFSDVIKIALSLAIAAGSVCFAEAARQLPTPFAEHPGNIFTAREPVAVTLPREVGPWQLLDYDGRALGEFQGGREKVALGKLPVGFYRLEPAAGSNWVSLAVLEPLRAPTPLTSPIGVDVAMAWFYGPERMDAVAGLCAVAGVNWVRDRLNWAEMESARGRFSGSNKYDASALAQSGAGLRVLQVIHHSPAWANPNGKRFPLDLRDAYRFYEVMAKRWRGQVQAFEPWNEADIPMFGGHTGAEMASLQKAAYLGLKAGNPDMIVCLNVFAAHRTNQLADLHENETWPYFETYNLHHYEPFENYPRVYADHRAVSAGRPLWVSECAVPVKWAGDAKLKEPTDADLKVQAERVAKTFACSLHEGSVATFYFLLPHYVEGQTQFGIVRPDLTPRPAYVALAAAGRLLADAQPLGRVETPDAAVRVFAFRARPDGRERDVLVAWTTNRESALNLSVAPEELFDHLGRTRAVANELKLAGGPVFAILPAGGATRLGSRDPKSIGGITPALEVSTRPFPSPRLSPPGRGRTVRSAQKKPMASDLPGTAIGFPSPRGEGQGEGKGTARQHESAGDTSTASGIFKLTPPPRSSAKLEGSPSPVVLQALWPEEKADLSRSAYRLSAEPTATIPVYAYNFGSRPVRGRLSLETTAGWEATLSGEIELAPMDRKELSLVVKRTGATSEKNGRVEVRGDFASAGRPVLSLKLTTEAAK